MNRSIGVTIFGYFGLIMVGILALIAELLKIPKVDFINIFVDIAYIILSYNLLRLKNWARFSLLMLNIIFALIVTIGNFFLFLSREQLLETMAKTYPFPLPPIWGFIHLIVQTSYHYGYLIFFTRSKVKEQFK